MRALAFVTLLAVLPVRAATLHGVVLEKTRGGPPVANVQVSAIGANPATSHSNGTFVLDVPHKQPGDIVRLIVQKSGMVVVNDSQLEVVLPKDPERSPITLLLTAAPRSNPQPERHRPERSESMDRYREQLQELQARYAETAETVRRIQADRPPTRTETPDVETEARASAESRVYRDARSAVMKGDEERALGMLDDQTLQRAAAMAKAQQKEVVDAYLLKAELLENRLQLEQAVQSCEAAIAFAPEEIELHYRLGELHLAMGGHTEAESDFRRALTLARRANDQHEIALALCELGAIHADQERRIEARQEYEEAIAVYRSLARRNVYYKEELGATLNSLGLTLLEGDALVEADRALTEALDVLRSFNAQKLFVRFPDILGRVLHNTGSLRRRQQRLDEAEAAYREAAGVFEDLLVKKANAWTRTDVARTYNDLGILLGNQGRAPEALELFGKAADVYRALTRQSRSGYRAALASVLRNRALALRDIHRPGDARTTYEEALNLYRDLSVRNPNYRADIAAILSSIADLDLFTRPETARKGSDEAMSISRQLVSEDREKFLPVLASALQTAASVHDAAERWKERESSDREALAIYRELAVKDPARFLSRAAWMVHNLGLAERARGRLEAARELLAESIGMHRQLVEQDTVRYQIDFADALQDAAEVSRACEDYNAALTYLFEAKAIYHGVAEEHAPRFFGTAAVVLIDVGQVFAKQQKTVLARAAWEEALALLDNPRVVGRSFYSRSIEEARNFLAGLPQ